MVITVGHIVIYVQFQGMQNICEPHNGYRIILQSSDYFICLFLCSLLFFFKKNILNNNNIIRFFQLTAQVEPGNEGQNKEFSLLFCAISVSGALVLARMAKVVPVCAAIWTVPHCDLCSNLKGMP